MQHVSSFLRRAAGMSLFLLAALLLTPDAAPAQYFRFGKNKVQYEAHDWYYVQSKHFDVYYYEGGEYLANFTAKAAEEAYDQMAALFRYRISDRIPIIVYQSHNDFSVTNAVDLPAFSEGIGGVTELFKNRIAVPFTGDYRNYRRVVHHELVHAVLNDLFYGGSMQSILQNNIRLQIPLWFNEGLAEYAALGWDTESDMYLREAVLEDNLPDIPHLSGYFAYRGGQSMWDYLSEQYGREKIGEILRRLRTTRSVERSFKRATGLQLEELSDQWQRALKKIYFPETSARQDLDEVGKPIVTPEKHGGTYNTSPALSPSGERIAYITSKGGLFNVYLADAHSGKTIRKLVDGQTSPEFESLRILTPGLTWSPDGKQIAIAVKSGSSEAIALVDVQTAESIHYRIPDVDQITSVSWSPRGGRIAFSASANAQSDIYTLDLQTRKTTNHTSDIFSDHEPDWSPDGQSIVFHSDRGSYTEVRRYGPTNFDMIDHDYSQFDIYHLTLGESRLERLTSNEQWDEKRAKFGTSPRKVLFISDRNGIYNLYAKNLRSGRERPLTNVVVGIMQLSLSSSGQKLAVTSLRNGTPSIYILDAPFSLSPEQNDLQPNVWAQRVMQDPEKPAPALVLAPPSLKQKNPFLRDASDGVAYARSDGRRTVLPTALLSDPADSTGRDSASSADAPAMASDTTVYGNTRVDFQNYVFGEAFGRARYEEEEEGQRHSFDPFAPEDNVDEEGDYVPKPYKLKFSPDLVTGATNYDVLYGVQGAVQMRFSDMLGNHRILVSSNLRTDLRNSNYYLAYNYLPRRIDWSFFGYHTSVLLRGNLQTQPRNFYRYRRYGSGISFTYPFSKFQRLGVDISGMGVSQAEITDLGEEPTSRFLFYPALTFTRDVTTPGLLAPSDGHRLAVSLTGSPGNLISGNQVRFVSLLGDARTYTSFGTGGRYTVALRLSGGTSLGPDQQLFYSSGVQNWLNRRFDTENGLPIDNITDVSFAAPVLPLRGYPLNAQNGSHFGLANAELRMPLIAALLPGPLPILPLYNIQAAAFLDAGAIWGGRGTDRRFNFFRTNESGQRVLDDLLVGMGVGVRTILLGFPLRLDLAWPYNGRRLGDRHLYFSIGFDY